MTDTVTVPKMAIISVWNYLQSPASYSDDERKFVFSQMAAAFAALPAQMSVPAPPSTGGVTDEMVERADSEWRRWQDGSKSFHGRDTVFTVHRMADDGTAPLISEHTDRNERNMALRRSRWFAALSAALAALPAHGPSGDERHVQEMNAGIAALPAHGPENIEDLMNLAPLPPSNVEPSK